YYALGIVMIPGIIMGIWAQCKVVSTFNKYSKVQTKSGRTANEVARTMLDGGGCQDTKIQTIRGELTDNFNPQNNTVSFSQSVYGQSSVAAVGVAAHEIGHVFQHKAKYKPIQLRSAMVPIVNISNFLVWPLIIIGLIMEISFQATQAMWLIYIGLILYSMSTIFSLITLPVELNASKRAYKMLVSTGEMDKEEGAGVKKVLNAAAWTYIAGLVTSILSLLRLVLYIFMLRGDRN
ncbi:MAG: zinc metallopeptidase, partial [Clostridia bacterium]|nr:zinc metallopeptidase [Clostridia bacterium]